MLSTSHNFLFIHIPKTGGNSIQKVLFPYSDDELSLLAPHHDGVDRFEIKSPVLDIQKHSTLAEYKTQLDPLTYTKLIKVACVRNPWERCVSFFFSPHRGQVAWSPKHFAEFIETSVKPVRHFLAVSTDDIAWFKNIDVMLRFEHLQQDFAELCALLGITSNELPRINVSNRASYRNYYPNDGLIELVAEKFSDEISRFGYTF